MARHEVRIPLWLKIGYTAWVAGWAVAYGWDNNPLFFLWFCHVGNLVIALALWTSSRLLFSWQAVSLVLVQLMFSVDVLGRLLFGQHLFGGTEYMFDSSLSLGFRGLALFHVVMPALLLWGVWRLGYDPRAFRLQVAECWVLLPLSFLLTGPADNMNMAYGPGSAAQHTLPPVAYLLLVMAVAPLLIYWPTHRVLGLLFRKGRPVEAG